MCKIIQIDAKALCHYPLFCMALCDVFNVTEVLDLCQYTDCDCGAKSGLDNTEYAHIYSFRRFTYVTMEENIDIPNSRLINIEGDNYRIFLQIDESKCYKCGKEDHLAAKCTQTTKIPTEQTLNLQPKETVQFKGNKRTFSTTHTDSSPDIIDITNQNQIVFETQKLNPIVQNNEKTLETFKQPKKIVTTKRIKATKKPKQNSDTEDAVENMLSPIKQYLSNQENFEFTFSEFQSFYNKIVTSPHPLEVAVSFMPNIDKLIDILKDLYPLLTHQKIKYRFTRIINVIRKTRNRDSEYNSSSQESYIDNANIR
ncbi:hypothetical protein RN001_009992 [Aquatica leii]|uniref:CCHC-type domain-containing protein n=1 Tax=Aquatica leii TaxID=1421715 RepID=A0AAN7S8D7_9COLE|nr:hypothetical protein RN001_009992 [Aquatica leii]